MRSPDKRRYLNAIQHIESTAIPYAEDAIDLSHAEIMLGRELPPVWLPSMLPVKDYVDLTVASGSDVIFMHHVWQLGRKNMFDAEGRQHYVDGTIKTRDALAQVTYPDIDILKRRLDALLHGIDGTGLALKFAPNPAPFIVATAIGYQDYYTNLAVDPEFVHDFLKIAHDYCMRELEVALRYPIDVVEVCIVVWDKSGPMMSREMMEEFELPALRDQIQLIKSHGLPVSFHGDGNLFSYIPELIAMGIDLITCIEPCSGGQDIYRIKDLYGDKVALQGNIDLSGVLVFGTPDEVRADVIEHIEKLAVRGGYICSSSHDISNAVPLENFYALRDTVLDFTYHPPARAVAGTEPASRS
ncbi:MAG: uroporphyrinogen decarboxylase family protein [Armatimonadota bacterium]